MSKTKLELLKEEASKGFELSDQQVKEVDQASHNWYSDQVIKTYNSHNPVKPFEELTPAQQTVLTSVGFQHGTGFKRKDGSDMNFIKQDKNYDFLMNNKFVSIHLRGSDRSKYTEENRPDLTNYSHHTEEYINNLIVKNRII